MRRRYVTGVLADTSAWVEYLRATGSPVHLRLRRLIADEDAMVTTEVVVMELLAGASNDDELLERVMRRYRLPSCTAAAGARARPSASSPTASSPSSPSVPAPRCSTATRTSR